MREITNKCHRVWLEFLLKYILYVLKIQVVSKNANRRNYLQSLGSQCFIKNIRQKMNCKQTVPVHLKCPTRGMLEFVERFETWKGFIQE